MATQRENNLIIGTNIKRLLKEHNKTRKDVCQVLGFNYATFSDWLQGRSYPRPDKVDKLANYFNVPRSALVDPPATSNTTVTGDNNGTTITTAPPESHTSYYYDPEVAELADRMKNQPGMRILFDAAKDVSKEDLETVAKMMEALKKTKK